MSCKVLAEMFRLSHLLRPEASRGARMRKIVGNILWLESYAAIR
jgi:hypothetical protein